jgi:uncharacterized phage protein (TIGR02218 family)
MTYDTRERSLEDGQPVAMYQFRLGPTVWRYTSADKDVLSNGHLWKAVAISDDGVKVTGESSTDALNITAPISIGPAQAYIGTPPSQAIMVAKLEKHEGDAEAIVSYSGEISQVDLSTPGAAVIVCETLSASMQRDGLRISWQRACPYAVYDPVTCKAPKASFASNTTVTGIANGALDCTGLSAHADGYYSGGFVEWTDPVRGLEFCTIESHIGNNIVMFGMTDLFYVGMQLVIYKGCTRTKEGCDSFSNYDNYGGVREMPGRSPFDGNPVF